MSRSSATCPCAGELRAHYPAAARGAAGHGEPVLEHCLSTSSARSKYLSRHLFSPCSRLSVSAALTRHEQIDPSLLTPSPLPITVWSLGLLVVVLLPVLLRCEQTFWGDWLQPSAPDLKPVQALAEQDHQICLNYRCTAWLWRKEPNHAQK